MLTKTGRTPASVKGCRRVWGAGGAHGVFQGDGGRGRSWVVERDWNRQVSLGSPLTCWVLGRVLGSLLLRGMDEPDWGGCSFKIRKKESNEWVSVGTGLSLRRPAQAPGAQVWVLGNQGLVALLPSFPVRVLLTSESPAPSEPSLAKPALRLPPDSFPLAPRLWPPPSAQEGGSISAKRLSNQRISSHKKRIGWLFCKTANKWTRPPPPQES